MDALVAVIRVAKEFGVFLESVCEAKQFCTLKDDGDAYTVWKAYAIDVVRQKDVSVRGSALLSSPETWR